MSRAAKSKDYDIRAAVVEGLLGAGVARPSIRHEITMDTSSSGGRADIVLLHGGRLWGIEVKSECDTLGRLEAQIERYRAAFDHVRIVADPRHNEALPYVTGTMLWSAADGFHTAWARRMDMDVSVGGWLLDTRYPESPVHTGMMRLLWRDEAIQVAAALGGPHGSRTSRETAIDWLRENARLRELRPLVCKALRLRPQNRWEAAFWARFNADRAGAEAAE